MTALAVAHSVISRSEQKLCAADTNAGYSWLHLKHLDQSVVEIQSCGQENSHVCILKHSNFHEPS